MLSLSLSFSLSLFLSFFLSFSLSFSLSLSFFLSFSLSFFLSLFLSLLGSGLLCQFNDQHNVEAEWHSSSSVSCSVPTDIHDDIGAQLSVRISTNDGADFSRSLQSVRSVAEAAIGAVQPILGDENGSTIVSVTGSGFVESNLLTCVFSAGSGSAGVVKVPARWLSATSLECLSASKSAFNNADLSSVDISISNNGIEMGDALTDAFQYSTQPVSVLSVSPAFGPSRGSTLVTVTGKGFVFSETLRCKFDLIVVRATWIDQNTIACVTPAHTSHGSVAFEVSNNALDYSSGGVQFAYSALPTIASLYPVSGDVFGGDIIRLSGNRFIDSDTLMCVFGDAAPIAAVFVSETAIDCITPPASSEFSEAVVVTVDVSNNGVDYSNTEIIFKYTLSPLVRDISPVGGPEQGGSAVIVTGNNFIDSVHLKCKFGSTLTEARWLSHQSIECLTPASHAQHVSVQVTTNGLRFSNGNIMFEYRAAMELTYLYPTFGSRYILVLSFSSLSPSLYL